MRADTFPGWRVVTGAFVVIATASGLGFYGLAVYLNAFSRERGWDVASISLATTLFFLVSGACGVLVARLIERVDLRLVMLAGGVVGSGALALFGQVHARWQLYAVYIVFGAGFAATGLVPITTVVARWFHTRRSVALSVASTGLSAGGVVITPAAKWLIDEQGIATAAPILAAVYLVGTVPFVLWLVRPDPAALGWAPDGERHAPEAAPAAVTGVPFAAAVRTRFYLCVTASYVLVLGSQVGAMQQLVKLSEERTDAGTAALATLVLALASIVARLVGGRMVGSVPMVGFTTVLAVLQAVGLVALSVAGRPVTLLPAIVLLGVTVGNILMLQPLLIAERFGVRDYPRLFSRSQFVSTAGVAGGPLLLGVLHDHAGGYTTSYLVAAGVPAGLGALVLAAAGPSRVSASGTA